MLVDKTISCERDKQKDQRKVYFAVLAWRVGKKWNCMIQYSSRLYSVFTFAWHFVNCFSQLKTFNYFVFLLEFDFWHLPFCLELRQTRSQCDKLEEDLFGPRGPEFSCIWIALYNKVTFMLVSFALAHLNVICMAGGKLNQDHSTKKENKSLILF